MRGPTSSVFSSVRRPPRRRWLRTAKIGVSALLVLALLAVALVGAIWAEAWFRLGGEELAAFEGELEALGTDGLRAPAAATTVLVAMVEEHDPTRVRASPLAGDVALVQVTEDHDDVAVVLLPPRLEVTVEGEGSLPLTEVHERGGLDLLVRGVVDYTGVALDHAVAASVDALPELTAALGGVERCDDDGCRILDEAAVRLATTEGSGHERARATAAILSGLATRVGPTTPLRSPLRSRTVISTLSEEVVTDRSLRGTRVLDLASGLAAARPPTVSTVPAVTHPDSGRLVVRVEQAEILFQHLRQGTLPSDGEVGDPQQTVPEDVTVAVLNGTGTAGLAGRVASQVTGGGFDVLGTDNAAHFDHEETTVAYGAQDSDAEVAAVLLAEHLGGAALEPVDRAPSFEGEPVGVLVTVGRDLDEEEDE